MSLCGFNRPPRKENQTKITGAEIHEVKGAVGKTTLGQLFEADQEGKSQAADQGNPIPTPRGNQRKESQVDEKDQDSIQNEMTEFIRKGDSVDDGKNSKITCVGKKNDQKNKKREEQGEPLHKKAGAGLRPAPSIY